MSLLFKWIPIKVLKDTEFVLLVVILYFNLFYMFEHLDERLDKYALLLLKLHVHDFQSEMSKKVFR